ncbi:TonB-linked SusC/RagA family outer membrane protein [Larkinella arboricola]|uniref:TonB-linked SusC/RagA family outer membrane protein n=1 Tax=Larkinella arboricola TaxID=643671 RepID=A0A327WY08_LARAB|nr:SusC/RagA family TonB-linked outer membrane protein [Larkinella arboricola]RAJ97686.1 TonB-linked SusC/RagA family outer membrane protein [Larkinella arboricola]
MTKLLSTIFLLTFLTVSAYSQQPGDAGRPIRGKVIEQTTGAPLPGTNITIKGTSQGTTSDQKGEFSIRANPGQVLVFSFISYEAQEVTVTANTRTLDIALKEDQKQLSEVVVTGALGIKRAAREFGGGAQVVSNESLNQGKTVNPLVGLTSKVAGLRINMYDSKVDPQIQITMRGSRSLNRAKNAPIYVVDGIPVPEITRLNPNDIESITVLKGANAAALYGSEGVNGALMITTKSGSRGRGTVKFSNTTTFSRVFLLPPAQTKFGQGVNGVYDPTQAESWGPAFDGTMKDFGPVLPSGSRHQILYAAPSRDNRLDLFQTGVNLQNDVSFSGGDEKNTYFFSVQDVAIKGIIPEDQSHRTGARFNGTRKFGKLNTSYNVNYVYFKKNTTPDGPWITAYSLPANFDFNSMKDWQNPASYANPNYFFTDLQKNPYHQIDNTRDVSEQQTINGKVELDYQVTPWFNAMYRIGMFSTSTQTRSTTGKFEAAGRRNVNGSVSDGSNNFQRLNGDLILNFNKQFGKFSTRLILGQNFRSDYTKTATVSASNLLLPDLFNPGTRIGELTGSSSITQYRSLAGYGEFTGGYNNYLFLTLTGRNEWVSVLSKENRSYFYPGVSASFVFNEAIDALKNSRFLSFGKVFASWNKTGNVTLEPYSLNNPYSQINGFPFGNLVGFTPGTKYPNPNIQPEFVTSYEAGVQLGLLNNRLNVEGSYVFSDSKGQIFNATTSRATGYSSAVVNAGRLTNNIVELSVNGDVIRNSALKWNVGFNFTHINNEVKELYEGLQSFNIFRQSYANLGQQYPSLQVSDYRRDPQGRVIINPTTGEPLIAADPVHLGTMVPPYQMGVSTALQFKGFSVGAQFDWRMGGWLYSEIVPRMYTAGTDPRTAEFDRQPFIFPNSVIQNADGSFTPNTTVLSKGDKAFWTKQGEVQINTAAKSDYFKLRELSISYSLPATLLSKQKVVREASLGFVGTNLFIIRHKDNQYGDPEYLYNSTDGYLSFRQVPPYRTYGFNVNLTF